VYQGQSCAETPAATTIAATTVIPARRDAAHLIVAASSMRGRRDRPSIGQPRATSMSPPRPADKHNVAAGWRRASPRAILGVSKGVPATMSMPLIWSTGILAAMSLFVSAVPASAQSPAGPPATVAKVDLDRYAGRWFEIARFPNRFQKKCAGDVTAEYVRRPDGRIDVINRCRLADGTIDEAQGIARVATDDGSNAKLKVRFAPAWLSFLPVWGDYWVLELADDYSYAVVGDSGRNYLWVLARSPRISDELFTDLAARVAAKGFDVSRLERTPQALD
jgi:apolipoprotein D and lipocalin family protein